MTRRTPEIIAAIDGWQDTRGLNKGLRCLLREASMLLSAQHAVLEAIRQNPATVVDPASDYLRGMRNEALDQADKAARVYCRPVEVKGEMYCLECGIEFDLWKDAPERPCGLSPKYRGPENGGKGDE